MISLFGAGFIGSHFKKAYSEEVTVEPRASCVASEENILWMRSTVHNYHPKDGNLSIDIDTNLSMFSRALKLNHRKDTTFNLISSWFVYGKGGDVPAREDSPCDPTGFYSITARAREQLLISYCDTFQKKYRILRLGNVIGTGDKKASLKKNALQHFAKEIAHARPISIYKDGSIRDYIDVRDAIRAIKLVLDKGNVNEIFNVANGQGLRVKSLIKAAHREGKFKSKITEIPIPDFHKHVQTSAMVMDISKIKSLGYTQQHDIKESVEELVRDYKNES